MSYREQPSTEDLLRMLSETEKEKAAAAERVSLLEKQLADNGIQVPLPLDETPEKRHVLYLVEEDEEIEVVESENAEDEPFPFELLIALLILAFGVLGVLHWTVGPPLIFLL